MKNMVKSVAFFVILCFLIWCTGLVFRPKENTKRAGMTHVNANALAAEEENSLDVVFVGNSESYNTFIPLEMYENYGFTSYICGSGGQYMYETYYYVNKIFETQSPKLIVLEADTLFKKSDYRGILTYQTKKAVPLLEFHDRWKSLSLEDLYTKPDYSTPNGTKGYVLCTVVKPPKDKKDYMTENHFTCEVCSINEWYLSKIKELCEEHGSELLLVSAPSHRNWSYDRNEKVQALADTYSLEYLDFNMLCDEVQIDWKKDTKDKGDHLNYFGATKVSAYFGNWLADNYDLPDHRNDAAYADWDVKLKEFKEQVSLAVCGP
ncbi:MAG: hypothetical protein ACI39R_03865 [Lachnospiraceae bacterium]